MWNKHRVRNRRNAECLEGGPDLVYFDPAAVGARDYKFPLAEGKNDQDLRFCVYSALVNSADVFLSQASLIMTEENLKSS